MLFDVTCALSCDFADTLLAVNPSVRHAFLFVITVPKNTVLVLMQCSPSVVKTGSTMGVWPLRSNTYCLNSCFFEEIRLFFSCSLITLWFKLLFSYTAELCNLTQSCSFEDMLHLIPGAQICKLIGLLMKEIVLESAKNM